MFDPKEFSDNVVFEPTLAALKRKLSAVVSILFALLYTLKKRLSQRCRTSLQQVQNASSAGKDDS